MNSEDILYWPYTAKVGIVPCDSKNTDFDKARWTHYKFNEIDYKENIKLGLYNQGFAIKLGQCLTPFENRYVFALDFDGWDAVVAWFGSPGDTNEDVWDKVIEYSKITRIEWHQNKGRLHMIFFSNRPIKSKKIHINNELLEIRYNELLVCSPSINKDGNQWSALGTNEIAILDNIQLLTVEATIESLCKDYMSDDNKRAYIAWFENINNWKSIEAGQGRHNALKTLGSSWYNRYKDEEWRNLTDDQRKERLLKRNLEFKEPIPEKEFEDLWKWIVNTFRKERDQNREKWEEEHSRYAEIDPLNMPGCVYFEKEPKRYICGTPDNKLVEIQLKKNTKTIKTPTGEQEIETEDIIIKKTFTANKPVRIIKHKHPFKELNISQKYTIEFKGNEPSGNFPLKFYTIQEIANRLKDGEALSETGIETAINAQIKGFEKMGKLEENNEIEEIGFFLDDNNKLFASQIEIKSRIDIDRKLLKEAIDAIEDSKKYFEGRLDLFATALKWAMIAPLGYVVKQLRRYVKWLVLGGYPNTSKSVIGSYVLAIDGHHNTTLYNRGIGEIDRLANLQTTIEQSTFPILVDEGKISTNERTQYMIDYYKRAIDSKVLRSKFPHSHSKKAEDRLALSPLVVAANDALPDIPAIKKRCYERYFSLSEKHDSTSPESKEFEKFLINVLPKLAIIGDYRNAVIMEQPDTILDFIKDNDLTMIDIGKKLLKIAYKDAGIENPPEWLDLVLPENQLEEAIDDSMVLVRHALETYVQANFRNALNIWQKTMPNDLSSLPKKTGLLLIKLIDDNKVIDIKRRQDARIMISKGILQELYKTGLSPEHLPNLKTLGDYLGVDYKKYHGYWHLVCDGELLLDYFDKTEE